MLQPKSNIHRMALAVLALAALGLPTAASANDRANAVDCEALVQSAYWDLREEGKAGAFPLEHYRDALAARAERTARQVAYLRVQRGRDLGQAELQAEIDRIGRDTRAPEALAKLFKAMGNDPRLIGECFAKPLLADRLARRAFAADATLQAPARERAHAGLALAKAAPARGAAHGRVALVPAGLAHRVAPPAKSPDVDAALAELERFNVVEWRIAPDAAAARKPRWSRMVESDEAIEMLRGDYRDGQLEVRVLRWAKPSFDAWWTQASATYAPDYTDKAGAPGALVAPQVEAGQLAGWDRIRDRDHHGLGTTAWSQVVVGTGAEMLLWGGRQLPALGNREDDDQGFTNQGLAYNPIADTWRLLPVANAPRMECGGARGVWTGTRLLVVRGECLVQPRDGGTPYRVGAESGLYDPVADAWTTLPAPPASWDAADEFSLVWTGSRAIVYGGFRAETTYNGLPGVPVATGATLDPATATWTPFSIAPAQVGLVTSDRRNHQALWTGSTMLVFGGFNAAKTCEAPQSAFAFNPFTGVGATLPQRPAGQRAPLGTLYWNGTVALFHDDPQGGFCGGAWESPGSWRFSPAQNAWTPMSTTGAPGTNTGGVLVGTDRLVVWTGWGLWGVADPASVYRISTDTWTTSAATGGPAGGRTNFFTVAVGNEALILGGNCDGGECNDGWRLDVLADAWTPMSPPPAPFGPPSMRERFAMAGSATELYVWGGEMSRPPYASGDGKVYDLLTDTWAPLPATNAPSPREAPFGAYARGKLLVWGGIDPWATGAYDNTRLIELDNGKVYDVVARTWTAIPAPPLDLVRKRTGRAWDGSGLVVWGGSKDGVMKNTGARYDLASNAWTLLPVAGAPSARENAVVVSNGAGQTLFWRGWSGFNHVSAGAVYASDSNAWTPVPDGGSFPENEAGGIGVWLGGRFGVLTYGYYNARMMVLDDPAAGQWREGSGTYAPDAAAVGLWTGTRALVWGRHSDEALSQGWTYRVGPDRWTIAPRADSPYGWSGAMMARVGTRIAVWGGVGRNSGSLWHDDTRTGPLYTDLTASASLIHQAGVEGAVRFRVTATNLGPHTATATTLDFNLAAHLNYEGVDAGEALCAYPYNLVLSCTFDALAPGESREMIVSATLAPDWRGWPAGTAVAVASVHSGGQEGDPVLVNNTAPALVLPLLTIAPATVTEGNDGTRVLTFVATLERRASQPVTFDIATVAGTALAGSDFVAANLVGVTIPKGQLAKAITVVVNGDTAIEPIESFTLRLSNVFGAMVELDAAAHLDTTGYIINDDGPLLSVNNVSVAEGGKTTKLMTFTVSLSQAAPGPVTYDIATTPGTASSGDDFVALDLTGQVIPAGELTRTHSVTINGDEEVEANEKLLVYLRQPTGASVWDGQGVGHILNDDGPTLSIPDAVVVEGDSGTKMLNVTVRLSQAAAVPVTYSIATGNGSATAGSDYTALSLVDQVIPAGALEQVHSIVVAGDTVDENNETFTVAASGVSGATVFDGAATATIYNDDGPTLTVTDATRLEGNAGTKVALFTVTLSQVQAAPVTYNIATSNVTATAGSDYVASALVGEAIPAGQLSKTFSVTLNGDTDVEANETFRVTLSAPTAGVSLLRPVGVGTISNDD